MMTIPALGTIFNRKPQSNTKFAWGFLLSFLTLIQTKA
ncbi:hypothetical protein CRYPA_14 [uncultured Candidatus Thioglobus sp.]|nr:hypothetical protein CRYPA_14 [uncultured Candidatus Thioglobus sp.]